MKNRFKTQTLLHVHTSIAVSNTEHVNRLQNENDTARDLPTRFVTLNRHK